MLLRSYIKKEFALSCMLVKYPLFRRFNVLTAVHVSCRSHSFASIILPTHEVEKTTSTFFVFHLNSTPSSLVAKNKVLILSLWPKSTSCLGVSCLVISSSLHIYQLPSGQWERDTDRMVSEWFVVLHWNHSMMWHPAFCINWYRVSSISQTVRDLK